MAVHIQTMETPWCSLLQEAAEAGFACSAPKLSVPREDFLQGKAQHLTRSKGSRAFPCSLEQEIGVWATLEGATIYFCLLPIARFYEAILVLVFCSFPSFLLLLPFVPPPPFFSSSLLFFSSSSFCSHKILSLLSSQHPQAPPPHLAGFHPVSARYVLPRGTLHPWALSSER